MRQMFLFLIFSLSACDLDQTHLSEGDTGWFDDVARAESLGESEHAAPGEVESDCCDACHANLPEGDKGAGGKVCCCPNDEGDIEQIACSFVDKFDAVPGSAFEMLDECTMEHEELHIDQDEQTCDGVAANHPAVFNPGEGPDDVEPDNYGAHIECLKEWECDGDQDCEAWQESNISTLRKACSTNGWDCTAPNDG